MFKSFFIESECDMNFDSIQMRSSAVYIYIYITMMQCLFGTVQFAEEGQGGGGTAAEDKLQEATQPTSPVLQQVPGAASKHHLSTRIQLVFDIVWLYRASSIVSLQLSLKLSYRFSGNVEESERGERTRLSSHEVTDASRETKH